MDTEAHTASGVSRFSKARTSPADLQLNPEKTENSPEAHGGTPLPADRSADETAAPSEIAFRGFETEGSRYDINAFKNPFAALVAGRAPRHPPYRRADSGPESPAEGTRHGWPFRPATLPASSGCQGCGACWSITTHLATPPVLTAAGSRRPSANPVLRGGPCSSPRFSRSRPFLTLQHSASGSS